MMFLAGRWLGTCSVKFWLGHVSSHVQDVAAVVACSQALSLLLRQRGLQQVSSHFSLSMERGRAWVSGSAVCIICHEAMPPEAADSAVTACNHRMHASCLCQWVASPYNADKTCPQCRAMLVRPAGEGIGGVASPTPDAEPTHQTGADAVGLAMLALEQPDLGFRMVGGQRGVPSTPARRFEVPFLLLPPPAVLQGEGDEVWSRMPRGPRRGACPYVMGVAAAVGHRGARNI